MLLFSWGLISQYNENAPPELQLREGEQKVPTLKIWAICPFMVAYPERIVNGTKNKLCRYVYPAEGRAIHGEIHG